MLRELGALDNSVYRQTNGVDTLTASQDLRRLRAHGLLEKKGKSSATYYVPGERFLASLPDGGGALQAEANQSTGALSLEVNQPGGVIPENRHQFTGVISPESHQLSDLPAALRSRVEAVGSYASRDEVKATIRALCAWRALPVGELAELLGREAKYLRRHYLSPMIEAGELEYTEPDMINHPRQAYRATGKTAGHNG